MLCKIFDEINLGPCTVKQNWASLQALRKGKCQNGIHISRQNGSVFTVTYYITLRCNKIAISKRFVFMDDVRQASVSEKTGDDRNMTSY